MREEIFEVKNPNQATLDPSVSDSKGLQLAKSLSSLVSGLGDLGVQISSIEKSEATNNLQIIKAAKKDFDDAVEEFGAETIAKLYIENKNKTDDNGNYIGFDIFEDKNYYDDAPDTFKKAYGEEKGNAVWKAFLDEKNSRLLSTAKSDIDSAINNYIQDTSKNNLEFNYLNDEKKPSFDVLMTNTYGKYLNEGNHPTHLKDVLTPLSNYITEKTNTLNNEQNKTILLNQKDDTKSAFANTFSSYDNGLFNSNNYFRNKDPNYKIPESEEDKVEAVANYIVELNNGIIENGSVLYGDSKKTLSPIPNYFKDLTENQIPNIFRDDDITYTEKINKVETLIDVVEALSDKTNSEGMLYEGIYEIGETINKIEKLIDENTEDKRAEDVENLSSNFDAFIGGTFGKTPEGKTYRGLTTILNEIINLKTDATKNNQRLKLIDEFNAAKAYVLLQYQKKLNDYYMEGIEDTMYKTALVSNQSFFQGLKTEGLPTVSDVTLYNKAIKLQNEGDPDELIKLINDNPRSFSVTDRTYFLKNPSKAIDAIKTIRSFIDSSTSLGSKITIGVETVGTGDNQLVMQTLEQILLKKPSDFKQDGVDEKDKFNHWYEVVERNGGDVAGNLFLLTKGNDMFGGFKDQYMNVIKPIGIEIDNE